MSMRSKTVLFAAIVLLSGCVRQSIHPEASTSDSGPNEGSPQSSVGRSLLDELVSMSTFPEDASQQERQEAVMQHLIELYRKGGEQFYELQTGRLYRDFPSSDSFFCGLDRNKKDKKSLSLVEYGIYFIASRRSWWDKYGEVRPQVVHHPGFLRLAHSHLFRADSEEKQAILANSIAREFALGGEVLPTTGKRGFPNGVSSISAYIDYLVKYRAESGYADTVNAINKLADEDPRVKAYIEAEAKRLQERNARGF
jgi:hypothetical protein